MRQPWILRLLRHFFKPQCEWAQTHLMGGEEGKGGNGEQFSEK